MNESQLRQQLIDYAQQLNSSGLSVGKSGNLSVRYGQGLLITPSGLEYASLGPEDIVYVDDRYQGKLIDSNTATRQPSSEWHFHQAIYRARSELQAIVHAHPNHCTALACTGRNIPAFHYMVAVAGGREIPISPYALFGSTELSKGIIDSMGEHRACLLANHGMLAANTSLTTAFNLALEIESLAQQYCQALQLGEVKLLSTGAMDAVLEKFQHYGQRS